MSDTMELGIAAPPPAGSTSAPSTPDVSLERLVAREDVVRESGRYALRSPGITRTEAMDADLRLVRTALDDAAIDYLLVRGDDDRPVLAVDQAARRELEAALARAFAAEPF